MAKSNGETTEIETLSGSVENVRFRNEETGYVVCDVKPAESMMSTVTVVGTCAAIWVGEELTAKGKWVTHPQYGRRFQADSIVCIAPASTEGILRFLSCGLIKGIGKIHAKRIVDKFGSDTLKIIEHSHKRLPPPLSHLHPHVADLNHPFMMFSCDRACGRGSLHR